MTRLLVILEAGDRWPSGTVRVLAYRRLLASHGFSATFVTRLPLEMMDWVGSPHSIFYRILIRPWLRERLVARATKASESRILELARNVDVVYLSKVKSYPLVQRLCRDTKARVVFDFGDADWLRGESANEFNEVLSNVDVVTTDNELTASYVRPFNPNCIVIPDAPQVEEFDKRRAELGNKPDEPLVLGWIGQASTAYNLYVIWEALEGIF